MLFFHVISHIFKVLICISGIHEKGRINKLRKCNCVLTVSIHNSSTFIKDVEINSITTSCCCFCCCFAVVSVDDDNNDDDGDALLQPILITI